MPEIYEHDFYVSEYCDYDSYTHHDGFRKAVILAYHAEGQAKEPISCG